MVHLAGFLNGVTRPDAAVRDVLNIGLPSGTEGPAQLARTGRPNTPGDWYVTGDLRDLTDDDLATITLWFGGACRQLEPTEAALTIDIHEGDRYRFKWTGADLHLLPRRQL